MRPVSGLQIEVPTIVWSLALTFSAASVAVAQFGGSSPTLIPEKPHASMRLAIEHEALIPGDQELVVIFTIDDDWHLYWQNPGDTGLPPDITFDLPQGIKQTADLRWPAPQRYIHGGGQLLDYIYKHEVALLLPVHINTALLGSTIEINATASWLVCKDACVPGDGTATLRATVQRDPGTPTSDARAIGAARARTPNDTNNTNITAHWDGLTLEVTAPGAQHITLYPLEPTLSGPIDAITDAQAAGETLRLRFGPRAAKAERVIVVIEADMPDSTHITRLQLPAPRLND